MSASHERWLAPALPFPAPPAGGRHRAISFAKTTTLLSSPSSSGRAPRPAVGFWCSILGQRGMSTRTRAEGRRTRVHTITTAMARAGRSRVAPRATRRARPRTAPPRRAPQPALIGRHCMTERVECAGTTQWHVHARYWYTTLLWLTLCRPTRAGCGALPPQCPPPHRT